MPGSSSSRQRASDAAGLRTASFQNVDSGAAAGAGEPAARHPAGSWAPAFGLLAEMVVFKGTFVVGWCEFSGKAARPAGGHHRESSRCQEMLNSRRAAAKGRRVYRAQLKADYQINVNPSMLHIPAAEAVQKTNGHPGAQCGERVSTGADLVRRRKWLMR